MIKKLTALCFQYTFTVIFTILYTLQFVVRSLLKGGKEQSPPIDVTTEPRCLNDPSLGKHGSVQLRNRNIEIHYVAKGDPSKPLMLFVHGFPEFWYSWRHQIREFGDDFYAVAMDLTGYGGSSKPTDVDRYHALDIAEDIKEFILELGFKSCVLVGHDWGGVITYLVANEFPEVVDTLIVMNAPNRTGLKKAYSLTQFLKSSYIFFFQAPVLPEYFLGRNCCSALSMLKKGATRCKNDETFTDEDLIAYRYTFMKGGFTAPLNYYRNVFSTKRKRKRLHIQVPSLIIWGTDDGALGKELAVASAQAIDNCSVKFVEGASHWVNQERPNEVNKIIRDYMKTR